jgi:superoxide dismutase, Fe-Mn family
MTYEIKPLSCNPTQLKGLSEKLIVSHYENNYSGAVKRLNAITAVSVINGLKREELIANNSMILHELYFDSRGKMANPVCCRRLHEQYQLGSALYWNQVRT